ncbi:hypothetical protein QR680_000887 [Steinernema hermaphroditum]|uniref:Uncharacterized protein n=1 Tax=Steinernema hermaphroditum TaxID=289476 RepID=A0AA39GXS8_9BILA|nr:hypothetical protein QR680_000887 [Steinernema hermaphroditum]
MKRSAKQRLINEENENIEVAMSYGAVVNEFDGVARFILCEPLQAVATLRRLYIYLMIAEKMKNLSRGDALQRILFTDEKIFTVQPHRNSQNQRELLPKGSPRVVKRENVHFPQSIMVWGGISGLGKTKLVFVPKGAKINADTYRELILEGAVIPWAQENAENIEWSLQQDWAPAHGAKKTLQWCEANLPSFWSKDVWPSKFAGFEPSRLFCLGKRLDACIAARGSHFE